MIFSQKILDTVTHITLILIVILFLIYAYHHAH